MSEDNKLFVLPFDHRGSFLEEMLGVSGDPSKEEIGRVKLYKQIIYSGFKVAMLSGLMPKNEAAILVDEEFGDSILIDAKKNGYKICVCVEKSGEQEFDFEYGDEFRNHINKYRPEYVKVLIRYNPEGDQEMNKRQIEKLKMLCDFCYEEGYKIMLEPLVLPTERQLDMLNGDRDAYDQEMRPRLMELMIEELQAGGVEPDIWKIEGLEEGEDYKMLVEQIRSQGRSSNIIILGRHASSSQVERWLIAGRDIDGVIGFAIGRTIFWEPLEKYKNNEITSEEAIQKIAENYEHFYKVFQAK